MLNTTTKIIDCSENTHVLMGSIFRSPSAAQYKFFINLASSIEIGDKIKPQLTRIV